MGNFHCIPDGCATVQYRPYLPPVMRFRYPGGNWREIKGDDYSIEPHYNENTRYSWKYKLGSSITVYGGVNVYDPAKQCGGVLHRQCSENTREHRDDVYDPGKKISSVFAPIYKYKVEDKTTADAPCVDSGNTKPQSLICSTPTGFKKIDVLCHGSSHYSDSPVWVTAWYNSSYPHPGTGTLLQVPYGTEQSINYDFESDTWIGDIDPSYGWEYFDFLPSNNNPRNCLFKVFLNGETVFEQISEECPEVEILPCRPDPALGEIKIPKLKYLEKIVVNQDIYDSEFVPILNIHQVAVRSGPPNCIQIYRALSTAPPIPIPDTTIPSVLGNPWQLIKQVCSANDCPPPQYQVLCECDPCRDCPPNTCAVECEGHICCHDSTGKAIEQIPIDEYCGNQT